MKNCQLASHDPVGLRSWVLVDEPGYVVSPFAIERQSPLMHLEWHLRVVTLFTVDLVAGHALGLRESSPLWKPARHSAG